MSELSESVERYSKFGIVAGFIIIFLGVLAVLSPFISGIAITILTGIILTVAGIILTIYAFKAVSIGQGLLQFLFGGITVICGLSFLLMPTLGMITLTTVLVFYFIIDGIFVVITGFQARPASGWGWVVLSGLSSFILGALLWYEWPLSGAYAIGILVGIRLIFAGWSIAMLGLYAHEKNHEQGRLSDSSKRNDCD